jgi:hypothetical protein
MPFPFMNLVYLQAPRIHSHVERAVKFLEIFRIQNRSDSADKAAILKIDTPSQDQRPFADSAGDDWVRNHQPCIRIIPLVKKVVAVRDVDMGKFIKRTVDMFALCISQVQYAQFRYTLKVDFSST